MSCWRRCSFAAVTLSLQLLFLILFGVFARYQYGDENDVESRWFYPMFQNVHVMMFIGFGFLMTFLKKYGYSAVSINFLIASLVIQWHIIVKGLFHLDSDGKFSVGITNLIFADFTAAAVLISFGAVIGKTSPLQLLIMSMIEVVIFAANEVVAVIFQASDIGGSMVVHVFGAYFGLAVAKVIYKDEHVDSPNEGCTYQSDLFSMIGTIFLWLYWPSFNSAVATTADQQARAVVNTYLSLAACVLVTFSVSSLTDRKARFNMVHVQNATLAGGVAVGTAANFMIEPWGAILIGCIAGLLSVIGYSYIQPFLLSKLGLHDTCGVNNLHGMPGLLAAVIGAVALVTVDVESYGSELYSVFPAMEPAMNGTGRTASEQAGFQAATMASTLAIALVGGLITGVVLRFIPGLGTPTGRYLFSDEADFEVPDDFPAEYKDVRGSETTEENGHHTVNSKM